LKRIQNMGLDKLSGRVGAAPIRSGCESLARRALLVIVACSAALLLAGSSGSEISASETSASGTSQEEEGRGSATDKPNIIFVLTDDLDYASAQKMPEIRSQLIEEGLSLERTFMNHPICCPSRATILTGLYDHNHNVLANRPPLRGLREGGRLSDRLLRQVPERLPRR
jgi:hypothetical protein